MLDLDNTLWGGVIGEDGMTGIQLGHEGIGLAFVDFQRELLNLQTKRNSAGDLQQEQS